MSGTPIVARKAPYPVAVEAGKAYGRRACGRSAKQPLRDGAHEGAGLEPVRHVAEKDGKLFFCG